MPGTLLAAMLTPVPVQQQTTPASTAPWATSRATCSAAAGHGVSAASTAPQRITEKPPASSQPAMASGMGWRESLPTAIRRAFGMATMVRGERGPALVGSCQNKWRRCAGQTA